MFNLVVITNQNKLLTHFKKVLSHNFSSHQWYPQKCSGNLKVTNIVFLISCLNCPNHSAPLQHTFMTTVKKVMHVISLQ